MIYLVSRSGASFSGGGNAFPGAGRGGRRYSGDGLASSLDHPL